MNDKESKMYDKFIIRVYKMGTPIVLFCVLMLTVLGGSLLLTDPHAFGVIVLFCVVILCFVFGFVKLMLFGDEWVRKEYERIMEERNNVD